MIQVSLMILSYPLVQLNLGILRVLSLQLLQVIQEYR